MKKDLLHSEKGLHFLCDLTVFITPNMGSAEQRKKAGTALDYQPFEGTREFTVNRVTESIVSSPTSMPMYLFPHADMAGFWIYESKANGHYLIQG